jgi:peptide-methionine (S)-S-oxide reductase
VIFYHDELQKAISEKFKNKLEEEKVWENKIVTEISPINVFYSAEEYHKDYFNRNPQNQYCTFVVRPKVEKFKKVFSQLLKN